MPGDGGYWYKQSEATLAAQQAAEKAATKKTTSGPKYIPRDQRVQTGPQPAANFTPNAANMDLVNRAYGNIGRASVGANLNQIDQGGQNYWMNQLNSGAISPQDFASIFSNAAQAAQPATANMYQNQALSQIRGARPSGDAQQFYQPVYQSQYQNYNMGNPMSISQYGQQPQMNQQTGLFSTAGGNTLTPELARTLMQRSMTSSGVPTSEFQRFGGYDAVKALYDRSGGDYSGQGNPYPQQQFNPYTNQYQTPFSYQQPQYQQQQMQTPFSYQQPVAQRMSSGPSQAIVGRSSQMRGTPNVMRRAEGGIASLMDNDE